MKLIILLSGVVARMRDQNSQYTEIPSAPLPANLGAIQEWRPLLKVAVSKESATRIESRSNYNETCLHQSFY